jgi:hypothetical protein
MSAKGQLKSYTPETAPRQGSVKGRRYKLGSEFLYALQHEFAQFGEAVIRKVRIDHPVDFLKIIASVLPREIEVSDSRLRELSDAELDSVIEFVRDRLAGGLGKPDSGEGETLN